MKTASAGRGARCAAALLGLLPPDLKRRLGRHLGAPDIGWSLRQLHRFGFRPANVLDAGAHVGNWAGTCHEVFPQARITCIEPQQAPQADLGRLAARVPEITVIQTLLGRRKCAAVPFGETGSGSSVFEAGQSPAPARPMTTIDSLIRERRCSPPELLKLDVQGYEIEVLEGWTAGFESCEVIQCEASLLPLVPGGPLLHEVVAYLYGRGFAMFDIDELIRSPGDGAVWQVDALFCRVDSALRTQRNWLSARS